MISEQSKGRGLEAQREHEQRMPSRQGRERGILLSECLWCAAIRGIRTIPCHRNLEEERCISLIRLNLASERLCFAPGCDYATSGHVMLGAAHVFFLIWRMKGTAIPAWPQRRHPIQLHTPTSSSFCSFYLTRMALSDNHCSSTVMLFPRQKRSASSISSPTSALPKDGVTRKPMALDRDLVAQFFHMPITDAAREFGICVTSLKKVCRQLGYSKWLYVKPLKMKPMPVSSRITTPTGTNSSPSVVSQYWWDSSFDGGGFAAEHPAASAQQSTCISSARHTAPRVEYTCCSAAYFNARGPHGSAYTRNSAPEQHQASFIQETLLAQPSSLAEGHRTSTDA